MNPTSEILTLDAFTQRKNRMPLAPYLLAILVLAAASIVPFTMPRQLDEGVMVILRAAYYASFLTTAVATFRWGHTCGFTVRDFHGNWSLTNFLRNTAMALVMSVLVILAASAFVGVATSILR